MPAMLDDPSNPAPKRVSGRNIGETLIFEPKTITLKDGVTKATVVAFASPHDVPTGLSKVLCDTLNREIQAGDTYPMTDTMELEFFRKYWFALFAAVVIKGEYDPANPPSFGEDEDEGEGEDEDEWWAMNCLGSFYIKPNYPGRCSHVCNAGFLVTEAARNKGLGGSMGKIYLEWAPRLGYTYSVFNLVFATNIASIRIWEKLGFQRIGVVPGCGNLKSSPGKCIDAYIYGRTLTGEADEKTSEPQ